VPAGWRILDTEFLNQGRPSPASWLLQKRTQCWYSACIALVRNRLTLRRNRAFLAANKVATVLLNQMKNKEKN